MLLLNDYPLLKILALSRSIFIQGSQRQVANNSIVHDNPSIASEVTPIAPEETFEIKNKADGLDEVSKNKKRNRRSRVLHQTVKVWPGATFQSLKQAVSAN